LDPDTIQELFAGFGAVSVRRMFGGAGLYADGVMFGLLSDGQIFLKADAGSVPAFEREGCAPFAYATKTGKRAVMSFWRLPDRLYDDPDELAQWARTALSVAHRSAAAKPKKLAKRRPKLRRPRRRRR
jgi:DNA transformation protein and related proteins